MFNKLNHACTHPTAVIYSPVCVGDIWSTSKIHLSWLLRNSTFPLNLARVHLTCRSLERTALYYHNMFSMFLCLVHVRVCRYIYFLRTRVKTLFQKFFLSRPSPAIFFLINIKQETVFHFSAFFLHQKNSMYLLHPSFSSFLFYSDFLDWWLHRICRTTQSPDLS